MIYVSPQKRTGGTASSGGVRDSHRSGDSQDRWPPAPAAYDPNYWSTNGVIKEEWLTTKAEELAEKFLNSRSEPKLTAAQLRRFYNDVKALEARIAAEDFRKNLPFIKMLKAKAAYSCPVKGTKKTPQEFARFIFSSVDQIETVEDFKAFSKAFEAVVAYFYAKGGGQR